MSERHKLTDSVSSANPSKDDHANHRFKNEENHDWVHDQTVESQKSKEKSRKQQKKPCCIQKGNHKGQREQKIIKMLKEKFDNPEFQVQ